MKTQLIATVKDLDRLEQTVVAAASSTAAKLSQVLSDAQGIEGLAGIRFRELGCDPLDVTRALNFVEQLNQTFTYLASFAAAHWLLERLPQHAPYTLNLGTAPGADIVSADGAVVAETFAATHPDSNNKLRKDVAKVRAMSASHRYVFYLSPFDAALACPDVTIVRLGHACLDPLWQR